MNGCGNTFCEFCVTGIWALLVVVKFSFDKFWYEVSHSRQQKVSGFRSWVVLKVMPHSLQVFVYFVVAFEYAAHERLQ